MSSPGFFAVNQEITEANTSPFMPKDGMNGGDEPDRNKLAREVEDYYRYYQTKLTTPYQDMVRWNKLFINDLKDRRGPDEKWRAFVPVPWPFSTIKVMSSAYNDMVFGQTPPIRPHGVSARNQMAANNIERLFSFVMRRTRFPQETKRAVEQMGIQGVSVRKSVLIEESMQRVVYPDERKATELQNAVADAMSQGIEVPDMNDRETFEQWRLQANEIMGLGIPELPIPGPRKMRKYFGPSFQDTSIFDLSYDPDFLYPQDLPIVLQRSIKPISWVMDRTGPEANKIFDPEAVAAAQAAMVGGENTVTSWQQDIQSSYGLNMDRTNNPYYKNAVEIWEVWFPAAKKHTYRIVMNRNQVINKNMDNPYSFPHPYVFMRNNTVSGNMLGVSEFKVVERMFYEMNTLRSLRLDALMLNVIPMFVKGRDGKMGQNESFVKPGKVFTSSNPDAFRQLVQMGLDPSIFKEEDEIKNDINEATGTLPALRGATAAPRTPSGNVEAASQASFLRIKDRILEFEGEMQPWVTNSLAIMYDFWPTEMLVRVGGDPKINPFVQYKQDDFLEALEADYEFQGARTAFDQDALLAQAKEWFTILAGAAELVPDFKPSELARLITQMILKDGSEAVWMSEEEMMKAQEEAAAAEEEEVAEEGEESVQAEQQAEPAQ